MGFDIAKIIDGQAVRFSNLIELACRHYSIEPISDVHTGGYYDYRCQKCGQYFDRLEAKALFDRADKELGEFMELAKARELVKANE